MSACVVAYVPVLHDGYRRFLESHGRGARLFVVGPELYADYRPLAKDIRALPAELVARSIEAWGLCREVSVLTVDGAQRLADELAGERPTDEPVDERPMDERPAGERPTDEPVDERPTDERPTIVMPAEDVSYRLAERFFARCEVRYDTVFLRWDKTKTAQLLRPAPARTASEDAAVAELAGLAHEAAARSVDWWRQVGAAMRLAGGELRWATNVHNPHPLSAYVAGDPRANNHKGVAIELSTVTHAEARLIAEAAREGRATEGAVLYVTDFPCPPCAKLIAAAGIAKLYFRDGYAVLDGEDVLRAAGVEIVQLETSAT